ncbi:MAG: cupredoxin domain-containing protein [Blastocatellia bacterium]|nr:cupredoxin domain-containing protein [Blastocatellia bacterium]
MTKETIRKTTDRRRTMITTISLCAIALALVVIANAHNWRVMGKQPGQNFAGVVQQNDSQTANVAVTDKGFEPSSLKLKTGVPAKVTFTRKSDDTCADEVVIKDYNIDRKLPLNEPVTVEFTPRKGEFTYGCGMGMVKGKLVVE